MKSVFGKVFVTVMLVLGLTATSCNQKSSEVKVKEDKQGNKEVRMQQRQNTDSVDIKRDQRIKTDADGDKTVKENSKVEVDRNNNSGQGAREGTTNQSTRSTNQGNDNTSTTKKTTTTTTTKKNN
ncbi:MAG: hypothetical protein ACM3UT_07385 [Chloroflexota bacterium]